MFNLSPIYSARKSSNHKLSINQKISPDTNLHITNIAHKIFEELVDPRVKNNLQVLLEERLHCVAAAEPAEQWKQMKTILQETTAKVVGTQRLV